MARLTPAELEALRLRVTAPTPAASAPVTGSKRLSPAELEALRLQVTGGSPSTGAAPTATTDTRIVSAQSTEQIKAAQAQADANQAADKVRQVSILAERQANPETFSQDVARRKADEDVAALTPPIQAGGYDLTTYTPLGMRVTTRPMDVAVPSNEAPTIWTALAPQVRAGEIPAAQDARRVGQVFDDQAYLQTLAGLPESERKNRLDAYESFKVGFKKLRELNPVETGVTDDDLIKDLQRQIAEYGAGTTKKFTQTPETEGGGDPLARAFQPQVTSGTVPMLEPGALAFVSALNQRQMASKKSTEIDAAIAKLKAEGVPVTKTIQSPTEGAVDKVVGNRPATESDIQALRDATAARIDQTEAPPFFETENRDAILADIESNAKGGTLFEKQYPTGATVEGAMSHGLRVIFAVPNAIAGTASELFTPEGTTATERTARPPLYRDASAATFNIADNRGFMGEVQDLYRYSPSEWARQNEWIGTVGGFAADMLTFDAAAIGAGAEGIRTLEGVRRAGMAAERSGLSIAKEAVTEATKTAGGRFLKDIGLTGAAAKLNPGDVRLASAAVLADNMRAADSYERAITRGASHEEAILAAREVAPKAKAIESMEKNGPSFVDQVRDGSYLKGAEKDYTEFKKIAGTVRSAADAHAAGQTVNAADAALLRPYLAAASQQDAGVRTLLSNASRGRESGTPTLRLSAVLGAVSDPNKFYGTIRDAAAFDHGFKAIDRAVGSMEPGRVIVAVTPRTFATEAGSTALVQKIRQSGENKILSAIVANNPKPVAIDFVLDGQKQVSNGYAVSERERKLLKEILSREANTGTMPQRAVDRAQAELGRGVISTQTMREINYSVADRIADVDRLATGGSFRTRALADAGKSINYGEQTNVILNSMRKMGEKIALKFRPDAEAHLARLLDPAQLEAVADAKRRMGEIDKTLKQEFESLADPAVAASYGLHPGVSYTTAEKLAAITFGREANEVSRRSTLYNYALSTIFGTDNLSSFRFFSGSWKYDTIEDIFNSAGRAEVDKIIDKYVGFIQNPQDAVRLLPEMSQEIHALKEHTVVMGELSHAKVGGSVPTIKAEISAEKLAAKEATAAKVKEIDAKLAANKAAAKSKFEAAVADVRRKAKPHYEVETEQQVAFLKNQLAEANSQLENIAGQRRKLAGDALDSVIAGLDAKQARRIEELATKSVAAVTPGTATNVPAYLSSKYRNTGASTFVATKPEESLLGAYARNKANAIYSQAMEKALANDPLTLGFESKILAQLDPAMAQIHAAGVVHQLSGGAPLSSIDDLLALPRVQELAPAGGPLYNTLRNKRQKWGSAVMEDVNATAVVAGRKFGGGVPAETYAHELSQLASGEIKFSELGDGPNPFALRKAMIQELGNAPKFGELQSELGKLAEEAARGSKSAAGVSRHVSALFDTINSLFYNAILTWNPRFHGRNVASAPFIVHMTTGIGLNPDDMVSAAKIMDPVIGRQSDVVLTDRLGNPYTAKDLYDAAVRSGALRSQMQATMDPRFLDEAAKLGIGSRVSAAGKGIPKTLYALPAHMANVEDNMFRLATISHAIKGGATLDEALLLGRKSLFDFGAATDAERKYVAGRILFYNYFRNSVIQGAQTLLANPARVLKQYRLVTDASKIMVGDKNWEDLRFYSPEGNSIAAGVASIATKYAPTAGREGQLQVLPAMPYYDAAYLTTGLLYQPGNLLLGNPDLVTGRRDIGGGYLFGKLTPTTKFILGSVVGADVLADVRMKKNQLSPMHLAVADKFGMQNTLTNLWGAKPRPALPGETAYQGQVWEMTPDSFHGYQLAVKFGMQNTGVERMSQEWGKIFAGSDLSGPTGRGIPEIAGLRSGYAAPTPTAQQTEAAATDAMILQNAATQQQQNQGISRPAQKSRL